MASSSDCSFATSDESNPDEFKKQYEKLLLDYDELRQKFHEASMERNVLKMSFAEISGELNGMTNSYEALRSKYETKAEHSHQLQIEIMSQERVIVQLQEEKADMQECIKTLSEQLENSRSESRQKTDLTAELNESLLDLAKIEELNAKLTETESMLFEVQQVNTELTKQYECLTERYDALQSNYETAKYDIEELKNHLEAAQEHGASLSNEIQELKNADGSFAKKGNSLFAEVDEQRQKLIKIIQNNKARFNALKAEHQKCPESILSVRNEMSRIESRINRYQSEIGHPENQYLKAIKELNSKITVDLQKMIDRNDYLQKQLATNSDAWIKSLIKYSSEEVNAVRRQYMDCYLKLRQAEDHHIWRAKELEQVRAELERLKLKSCWEQIEPYSKHGSQMSGEKVEKDETLNNSKDAEPQECEQSVTSSTLELIELGSSGTESCYGNIGIRTDCELALAAQSIKITENNLERPTVDKSSDHESQTGPKNISNAMRKPLVVKKIQLKRLFNPQ